MFGTTIIDPPWPYDKSSHHKSLRGYSTDHEYEALTIERLAALPIGSLTQYVFLWTTGPFIEDAYKLLRQWGFEPKTFMAWVKAQEIIPGNETPFKPSYGVGYWFRGCVEPIILAKQPDSPSIRTSWIGLLCPNARHSRKPDTLHELIEKDFPGPYLELFGRRSRQELGPPSNSFSELRKPQIVNHKPWTVIGNELCLGEDIEISIKKLLDPSLRNE